MSKGSPYDSKITSVEKLAQGNWIQTRKINYQDPTGKDRIWEMAVRTTRSETTNVDAVAIVSILHHPKLSGKGKEIIVVKQFRPPTEKVVLELPAGLIDPNETIATTAVREMIEETGYHGTCTHESIPMFSDPGLTNANMVLAQVDVDLDDERNRNVCPNLEDGEFIETITLPVNGLLGALVKLIETEGCSVDARLYHFALGLEYANTLST